MLPVEAELHMPGSSPKVAHKLLLPRGGVCKGRERGQGGHSN